MFKSVGVLISFSTRDQWTTKYTVEPGFGKEVGVLKLTCFDGLVKVVEWPLEVIDSSLGHITSSLGSGEEGGNANNNNSDQLHGELKKIN